MEFSTFVSNLLTIPSKIITIVTMIALTYLSEVTGQLTWIALYLGQIWVLPFVVYLYVVDTETASGWAVYAVITLLLGFQRTGCDEYFHLRFLVKIYYVWQQCAATKGTVMTTEQKAHYLETTTDEGNKRLDFRLHTESECVTNPS
ncbi:hypothetical protein N7492_010709 [Penicillium capsulatum]|uniref:Uncharacterized protein n=1 Tax=Penicillium capsulatum TaxID=69766 RepID=A0A9W9HRX3_9EURO|nr:hypothetical protein N7492_010709 [Penicillium capsulatum]